MSNQIKQHVKAYSNTECQAIFAGIHEGAHIQEILHQFLPGTEITVQDALNSICEYVHPGASEKTSLICGLVNSLRKIGLRVARVVPGIILGQNEARLYVQPRLLYVAYPDLKEFSPRPFAYTATLTRDELPALDGPASGFGFKQDWPENNEFEMQPFEESEEEEVVECFEPVLMRQILPRSEIIVAQAFEELCAGLHKAEGSSLQRYDDLHLDLEDIGVRFYRYSDRFDQSGLSREGFLMLENSRQFVRVYPKLDWMVPPVYLRWIAMLPERENLSTWTHGQLFSEI